MRTLLFSLCLILFGCKSNAPSSLELWMQPNGKVKVLCTTSMVADIVEQVGSDQTDVLILIHGEMDPHSYELVKGDDEKIASAQLIFYTGLGLEHGASLRTRLNQHPNAVAVGDEVRKKNLNRVLMEGHTLDPHIWMDISLWMETIEPVVEALTRIDPEHAVFYQEKGQHLRQKMQSVHDTLKIEFHQIPPSERYLVTSHDAFNYFSRAYLAEEEELASGLWKERFAAPEGLAPDGQLSSLDIQRIVLHLCTYQIKVVFPESNVSRDSLRKIQSACRSKGLEIYLSDFPLYGDTMGERGSDADTYLKMMEHNASVILSEWKRSYGKST